MSKSSFLQFGMWSDGDWSCPSPKTHLRSSPWGSFLALRTNPSSPWAPLTLPCSHSFFRLAASAHQTRIQSFCTVDLNTTFASYCLPCLARIPDWKLVILQNETCSGIPTLCMVHKFILQNFEIMVMQTPMICSVHIRFLSNIKHMDKQSKRWPYMTLHPT